MLRTYLYIPEHLDKKIKHTAKQQKKSKAEVMRQALEKGVEVLHQQGSAATLLKLAELGKKANLIGIHDSARIDELLWGQDWSKDD